METEPLPRELLSGGRLNAAITRAVVRSHSEHAGRGPTKASAFFHDNVIVVMLEQTMTRSEQSLAAAGRLDAVHDVRTELQRVMGADLVAAIETLTGCIVAAFMSDNTVAPDLAVELFVLDRPVPVTRGD
ncbi:MAG: hypothetical protein JWQ48_729 [Conexibacter sp.]|jgi:uncharacterized protein YbcI|nr:hypothetical protein [Conexibacter sp.]